MSPPRIAKAIFHFREKDAGYYAAAIAFYLLFSLAPFLLLTLSVAAVIAPSSDQFLQVFNSWFAANLPKYAQSMKDALVQVFVHRGNIGLVGLVWVFISARKLVNSIEIGLNAVLEIEKPKFTILSAFASLAFILVAAILFLSAVMASVTIDFALGIDVSVLGGEAKTVIGFILKALFQGAISIGLFFAIYRLAPGKGLSSGDASMAAVVATILWLVARQILIWFTARFLARFEVLNGMFLATLLLTLLWPYVFANALLMGACFVKKK